ncbi:EamA family transporter RarD [Thaumasiovibrio sp. DFM-14]|uniref:EamA family transporter RarD n=1 Tax=Thaumasiovibrio sp. DFM-14 TaxID=3384792 RepID=UPI00399FA0B1
MQTKSLGNILAATSFALWGLLPLYFQFLPSPNMDELLALRILGSVPFCLLLVIAFEGKLPSKQLLLENKRSVAFSALSGSLMCVSWYAFTWAMTNGRVLEASLGFFINPIMVVALGVVVMKDRLTEGQIIALCLATIGISYQIWQYGELPIIALIMASFFTLYGWCKKSVTFPAMTQLFLESLSLAPIAILFLLFKSATVGTVAFNSDSLTLMLYLGAAPVTLLPLIFYSMAVKRTTLTMIGLMQYIEPSLQFLLAVIVFGEVFDQVKAVTFGFIWLGLLFTVIEAGITLRNRSVNKQESAANAKS